MHKIYRITVTAKGKAVAYLVREKPGPQAEYNVNSLAINTLSRGLDVPRRARRQDYFKGRPIARWWWGLTGH